MDEAEKDSDPSEAAGNHVGTHRKEDPEPSLAYPSESKREDQKRTTSSGDAIFQDYYRDLPALHPRRPVDEFTRDTQPTLSTVTVKNGGHIQPTPNVQVSFEVLNLGHMESDSNKVRVDFKLRMLWRPALPEIPKDNKTVAGIRSEREPLPDDGTECQKKILQFRQKAAGSNVFPTPANSLTPNQRRQIDTNSVFFGPKISLQTTFGERDDPFFTATPLHRNISLGIEGTIRARKDERPCTPASGDLISPWELEAENTFSESLCCTGGRRGFPFDTQIATLHIHSFSGIGDIAFYEFSQLDRENLKAEIRQLSNRNLRWTIHDIQVVTSYRTLDGGEVPTVEVSDPSGLDSFRSKIVLNLTFGRNKFFWYMKLIFPLDVITTAGFCTFLVMPLSGPLTSDQQISLMTFLAGILVALSAFTISAQGALPTLDYMTVLDIHSYFCFSIIGILTVVVATNPGANIALNLALFKIIGNQQRNGVLLAILFIILVVEHLVVYGLVSRVWTPVLDSHDPMSTVRSLTV